MFDEKLEIKMKGRLKLGWKETDMILSQILYWDTQKSKRSEINCNEQY